MAASAIDIRGAKGPNAVTINGVYEPTEEVCNGWTVYRKRNDSNKWLEFFDASSKWYIKATTDKGRARGWMRLTSTPATRPEMCKSTCEVWDGSKWTSQPSVSIVTLKLRREEDKKAGAERRLQATPVDIRGAHGPSAASINGVYEPTNEHSGGWPVYRKQNDPDKWLEYIVATNEWYVKPTADKGRAEGWMCLASDPPTRPELSRGTCEVWDGDRWTLQSCVTVMTAACAFSSMIDVQLFCAEEAKSSQDKLCLSMKRALSLLDMMPSTEVIEKGNKQTDVLVQELGVKVAELQERKKKSENEAAAKRQEERAEEDSISGDDDEDDEEEEMTGEEEEEEELTGDEEEGDYEDEEELDDEEMIDSRGHNRVRLAYKTPVVTLSAHEKLLDDAEII